MYILLSEGNVIRETDEEYVDNYGMIDWRPCTSFAGMLVGPVTCFITVRRKLSAAAVKALRELGEI